MNREDRKITSQAEEYWDALDGTAYSGISATPERYYTELTRAIIAKSDEELCQVSRIVKRRSQEIVVLSQELIDIQQILSDALNRQSSINSPLPF